MNTLTAYYLNLVSSSTLTIVGVVGNLLVIVIMTRKKLIENPFFRYMIVSAFFDILNVLFLWISPTYDFLQINRIDINCKIYVYFSCLVVHLNPWLNVLSCIDRYLSVKYPTKCAFRKEFKYQFLAISLVSLSIVLVDIPYAIFVKVAKNGSISSGCTYSSRESSFYLMILQTLVNLILPCFVMLISIYFIAHELLVMKKKTTTSKKSFIKEKKIVITLFAINFFFIVTNLPYSLLLMIYYLLNKNFYGTLAYYIVRIVYKMYSSFAFFVFLASNTLFRDYFISIFSGMRKHSNSSSNQS